MNIFIISLGGFVGEHLNIKGVMSNRDVVRAFEEWYKDRRSGVTYLVPKEEDNNLGPIATLH
jgi:hypothetical protein